RLAGRNPPGGRFGDDVELGQLVVDDRLAQAGLLRKAVAEAQAVVVDAEHHLEAALAAAALAEADRELVVVVADEAASAPGLFPGFVEAAAGLRQHRQVAVQAAVAQLEPQPRAADHRLAETLD